jgi:hypothetical protein
MNCFAHPGILGLTAGLLLAGNQMASAQTRPAGLTITPVSNAALTAPIRNAYGKVKSVVEREVTLEVSGRTMTFTVDENTEILTRGAGQATRQVGAILPMTYFVRSGDMVRVAYRDLNGAMRVAEIHIGGRSEIASR